MEEQAKISLQESESIENAHYVFQNEHHPTIKVCISMDNSWCRTRHALIVARNVIAIADTAAQATVWLLRNFLPAGFNRSILISASDLVAANHSGIKTERAFFAVINGLGTDKANVQCHAMIYVSADVSTLYLSHTTLSDLWVCCLLSFS